MHDLGVLFSRFPHIGKHRDPFALMGAPSSYLAIACRLPGANDTAATSRPSYWASVHPTGKNEPLRDSRRGQAGLR